MDDGSDDPSDSKGLVDSKTKQVNLRVRTGQVAFWEDAAETQGMALAAWMKKVCTQAALEIFEGIDEKYGSRKNGK